MIIAVVGSGGKTTRIKQMTREYREAGKSVLVTTTTHMYAEEDTLLTDDADSILRQLKEQGVVMAGIPEGKKIRALSPETFQKVCGCADVVLVEADGSKGLPLKYPNATEPVIPGSVDEIQVICGLDALGRTCKEVCHRLELVQECLKIEEDTVILPMHIQRLVEEGYMKPLRENYPEAKITLVPRHDGSLYQRVIASVLQNGGDVSCIREEWFCPQPKLIICGGGHVAREVAVFASHLDFSVKIIDDRPELAAPERFPTADEVICDSYECLEKYLEPDAYYVVVTPYHKGDYQCVSKILSSEYCYLGMIGSRNKVANTAERLRRDGFAEEQIRTIFAPIGLPIQAVTPAEIAISILAQIIQEKNKTHVASVEQELLACQNHGVLCIIMEKQGSAPRGVGSMMLVEEERVLGSIGGGEAEYLAIMHARACPEFALRRYTLANTKKDGLDMICGGSIQVLFVPI